MVEAPLPLNEAARLENLYSFDILDTGYEKDFDDLVELVSQICECPLASITFIDKDRQWFKAEKNMTAREGSRSESFCSHTILEKDMLVVDDACQDERFFDNPHVLKGLNVRFYAGAPIVSSDGFTLGAVCAIDQSPRHLSDAQCIALKGIARQVSRLLDLRFRNKQLMDTAKRLISAEKKIAQLNLAQREAENLGTAKQLHDQIAQATSAVTNYIDFARNSKDLSDQFLNYSIEELKKLNISINRLSKSITPTTLEKGNYSGHIEALVESFESDHLHTDYQFEGDADKLIGNTGLVIFRIIQDLLQLAGLCNTTVVKIRLSAGKDFRLSCVFDDYKKVVSNERELLESNLRNRVDMLKGNFENDIHANNHTVVIKISIPATDTVPA